MGRLVKTFEEINRWHQEFQQTRCDWVEWLQVNASYYASSDDAWRAFQAQQQQSHQVARGRSGRFIRH